MSKHTRGPWRLQPWHGPKGATIRNRWRGIFEPIPEQALGSKSTVLSVGWRGDVEDAWVNISEANARLIAAAPDLLEALKWYVANDDTNESEEPVERLGGESWSKVNAFWIEGRRRAIAAIAKAEGE